MDEAEFYLAVESRQPEVVAFAPAVGSTEPRYIDFKNNLDSPEDMAAMHNHAHAAGVMDEGSEDVREFGKCLTPCKIFLLSSG